MPTDIDRLHAVADGRLVGRGCGKTFLRSHQVAGLIETGTNFVHFFVSAENDLRYMIPMLQEVFEEHGLEFRRTSRYEVRSGDATIRLLVHNTYNKIRNKEAIAGITGAIIKDLRWMG